MPCHIVPPIACQVGGVSATEGSSCELVSTYAHAESTAKVVKDHKWTWVARVIHRGGGRCVEGGLVFGAECDPLESVSSRAL